MPKLKILVVDDSVVARKILSEALSADTELEVYTSNNGRLALDRLTAINPDLVTLDVEMPEMDGLTTLKAMRKLSPKLPVIMFSSLTMKGASTTLDALAAGASDCIAKPSNVANFEAAMAYVRSEIMPRIKALCGQASGLAIPAPIVRSRAVPSTASGPIDIVAIGVSTGGPNALGTLMASIPRDLAVPMVIVQHMPPLFTKMLADRLSAHCKIPVVEGMAGLPLKPGMAVIAPGGSHMTVKRDGQNIVCALNDNPPENSCRPAVDVLFRSVSAVYDKRVLAVVMTGMGSDGLKGCEHIAAAGGQIVVQDEVSSVVWGMPGFVARAGLAQKQLPLAQISMEIMNRVSFGRRAAA